MFFSRKLRFSVLIFFVIGLAACGSSVELRCGAGTVDVDGVCVPESLLLCGEGTIETDGTCVIEPGFLDELWENAQFDGEDSGQIGTPSIGESTSFRGEVEEGSSEAQSFRFEAEAGQLYSITLYSLGLPAPQFAVQGPEGSEYRRYSPLSIQVTPQRYILAPVDGEYTIEIFSRLAGGDTNEDWRFVALLEQLEAPSVSTFTTDVIVHGELLQLPENFFEFISDSNDSVFEVEILSLGADAEVVVDTFADRSTFTSSQAVEPGDVIYVQAGQFLLIDYLQTSDRDNEFEISVRKVCDATETPFGGGTGEVTDPYRICSPAHFDAIMSNHDYVELHFRLLSDLDLEGVSVTPIGSTRSSFTGSFDGGGYSIYGFTMVRSTGPILAGGSGQSGLFEEIGSAGIIKNLTLIAPEIAGSSLVAPVASSNYGTLSNVHVLGGSVVGGWNVGGLVGANAGTIIESSTSATVSSPDEEDQEFRYFGGLVGRTNGYILDSWASGDVSGNIEFVGGLAGRSSGVIFNSSATGNVDGHSSVGGLVGINDGNISHSSATGIIGGKNYVGGLIGRNNSDHFVSYSYATGVVEGDRYVGGFVGILSQGIVFESFSTGAVSGDNDIGGFAGRLDGSNIGISDSYATGDVDGNHRTAGFVSATFSLSSTPVISRSYAFGAVSGDDTSAGFVSQLGGNATIEHAFFNSSENTMERGDGTPLSEAEFEMEASFVGWDFQETWTIDFATGRPILRWQQ